MEYKTFTCDRCGRQIDNIKSMKDRRQLFLYIQNWNEGKNNPNKQYEDICKNCESEIMEFLNKYFPKGK